MNNSCSVSQNPCYSFDASSLLSSPMSTVSPSVELHDALPYAFALPPRNSHHRSQNCGGIFNTDARGMEINRYFTPMEMKKIMDTKNKKLAEIALADPKRVKRILANRQSAARSKERKTRYVKELEDKVHILLTETTSLSTQLSIVHRESIRLANQNIELKIRLQALEQQSKLRQVLTESLKLEVQRLKLDYANGLCYCSSE